jgi:hypothetical protein
MLRESASRAWVTWPCREDPSFDAATANCRLVPVEEFSDAGALVVLPRRPQIDTLLTVKFKDDGRIASAPFLARVKTTQLRRDTGWFTHCDLVAPITESEPQALREVGTGT